MEKIIKAEITPQPKNISDAMPQVYVDTENAISQYLFSYYPDEIQFTPEEFIGLTIEEAHALKTKKDIAYLQG